MEFLGFIKIGSRITLYIPMVIAGEEVDVSEQIEKTKTVFWNCFHGYIPNQAEGTIYDERGNSVEGVFATAFTHCTEAELKDHLKDVIQLIIEIKNDLGQVTIPLEVNGENYLI